MKRPNRRQPNETPHASLLRRSYFLSPTGCRICTVPTNTDDYPHLRYQGKKCYAHRMSWLITYGPIPDGMFVCHRCDTPRCIEPSHLFLGTADDNNKDRARKRRSNTPLGSKWHASKLTEEQVISIRADTRSRRTIAADYGVTPSAIDAIFWRKNWTHI